jgi:hypothetical protein
MPTAAPTLKQTVAASTAVPTAAATTAAPVTTAPTEAAVTVTNTSGDKISNDVFFGSNDGSSTVRKTSIGLFEGFVPVAQREQQYGVKYDHVLLFDFVNALKYDRYAAYIDRGYNVILNMEVTVAGLDGPPVLQAIANGEFDQYFIPFAEQTVAGGRPFWIRTLHEQNGDWYPLSAHTIL